MSDRYPALKLNPAQMRRRILATLLALAECLTSRNPMIMMFEDAHWADASTLEFLALLVERIRQLPVLVLVTYRPGLDVPWSRLDHVGTLSLGGLDEENARSIIHEVSRDRGLHSEIIAEIVRKADGIPLFVEELVKTVLESGARAVDAESNRLDIPLQRPVIPASLRDSLMARLDRLASAKEIAQTGAVIGREFSHRLLAAVVEIPEQQLEGGLTGLMESGIINATGSSAERGYAFKHALIQDAAYETIAKSRRQNLHALVARAILNTFSDAAESQPEVLAHHYTKARMAAEALGFRLKSGKFAASRSAHKEAIAHFQGGLDLLKTVSLAGHEHARWELLFLAAMGPSVMAIHGFGAAESQDIFQRAHELLNDSTPVPDRLQVLCGLWNIRFHRAELVAALPIARRCLELAQASNWGVDLANCLMGQTLTSMGEFVSALGHFQLVADKSRAGKNDLGGRFFVDEPVLALTYMARIFWALGHPARSVDAAKEATALAQKEANPASVATALVGRLFTAIHGAPLQQATAHAREAIAYCKEHELVLFQHWTNFIWGALLAQGGDTAAGVEIMQSAVSAAEASQNRLFRPFQLACIGTAHAKLGDFERGLKMLGEAILMAEADGEKQSLATIYRLRGEILSGLGRSRDAEHAFASASLVARRQGARLEELRAAVAMARRAIGSDSAGPARKVLKEIYSQFEEGHELPDLRTARDLLNS